ncbi:hypothetical protein HXY32_03870 [Candidatus Bathyarchaeota archaeon]|nr:hypothetical protein [Candidatus Bathyarchaeota archaeon]
MKEKRVNNKSLFLCEMCGLGYLEKETAEKCEEWCKKTGTCSIEITKKAVYLPDPFQKTSK